MPPRKNDARYLPTIRCIMHFRLGAESIIPYDLVYPLTNLHYRMRNLGACSWDIVVGEKVHERERSGEKNLVDMWLLGEEGRYERGVVCIARHWGM